MKRDRRLQGLSSEHHHALVMARSMSEAAAAGSWALERAEATGKQFEVEMEPHFRVEEEVLLPGLRQAGEESLVARTEADHAFLRSQMALARAGDMRAAVEFADRLREHVRFEERDMFTRCEECLSAETLGEAARRAPKRP